MTKRRPTTLYLVLALYLGLLASSARAAGVVGNGSPASCTDAALAAALVGGGLVTFNCGPGNVVIPVNTNVLFTGDSATVDGADRVTLDGEDSRQHFYVLERARIFTFVRSFSRTAVPASGGADPQSGLAPRRGCATLTE